MYTKLLIPLDGSSTAEKVLPYARFVTKRLNVPVELLSVVGIAEIAAHLTAARPRDLDKAVKNSIHRSLEYLRGVATTFHNASVKCTAETGRPEEIIIARGDADPAMLIAMATHGRSGLDRWLMGSVAEKILRATPNPLLLIKATEQAPTAGESEINTIVVPLDGSELAETVFPMVGSLAEKLNAAVALFRVYNSAATVYAGADEFYIPDLEQLIPEPREEAHAYLEKKSTELKALGIKNVSYQLTEGFGADEIISFSCGVPKGLISMCSHGRSGVKRWALGSVTETVVRHSADPVLVTRAG